LHAVHRTADLIDGTLGVPTFAAAVVIEGRMALEHNAVKPLCACSTFKVAAATAVMTLVQEGAFALDRPVLQYDKSLAFSDPVAGPEITLRQLLSHTSGLEDRDDPEPQPRQCLETTALNCRASLTGSW
jgi:CubicO group peptidase (beta-lactamase class C family)